jgi:hypothetical protein
MRCLYAIIAALSEGDARVAPTYVPLLMWTMRGLGSRTVLGEACDFPKVAILIAVDYPDAVDPYPNSLGYR